MNHWIRSSYHITDLFTVLCSVKLWSALWSALWSSWCISSLDQIHISLWWSSRSTAEEWTAADWRTAADLSAPTDPPDPYWRSSLICSSGCRCWDLPYYFSFGNNDKHMVIDHTLSQQIDHTSCSGYHTAMDRCWSLASEIFQWS